MNYESREMDSGNFNSCFFHSMTVFVSFGALEFEFDYYMHVYRNRLYICKINFTYKVCYHNQQLVMCMFINVHGLSRLNSDHVRNGLT